VATVDEIEESLCRLERSLKGLAREATASAFASGGPGGSGREFTISSVAPRLPGEQLASFCDAELSALYGCLICVQGLFLQHFDRQDDAAASFVNAEPFLEAAVRGGPPTHFDGPARRFYMTCLVYAGQVERALELGEESVRRYGSAGLLRLLGEISNLQGSRLQGEGAEQQRLRDAAFARARDAFAAAERLEPGHKRSYTSWAFALAMLSDAEGCRGVAERAIARCRGFWVHPLQRPSHMVPALASRPWHEPGDFPWVRRLEERWRAVRAELDALARSSEGGDAWPEVRGHDRSLTQGSGIWREYPVLGLDEATEARARGQCPVTHALLSEVEAVRSHRDLRSVEETALFSRLTPGTHLKAHCGPTNTHLTCHLGLRVPEGCRIRVGGETREWREGRCLVFDDSFEHEVWHDGDAARVVLLVRFWHPDVLPAQRAALLRDDTRDRRSKAWTLL